jgi:tetratricopeptide (TPR) repeat protein
MTNTSYRLSLEARYFFSQGDFDKAYSLAKEAYIKDPYNRMAFTVYTQAQIAKQWQNFLKDADKYFSEIDAIANKPNITKKDKIKIKMMLEILLDEYKNLKPSKLLPINIKKSAQTQYIKAKEIYEKVFAKGNQ